MESKLNLTVARAIIAEERVGELEANIREANTNIQTEERLQEANNRVIQAEERTRQAELGIYEFEARALKAEEQVNDLEVRLRNSKNRIRELEEQASEMIVSLATQGLINI